MYESSGSQFFRTTAEIQSRPDAFDKSMLVMTFLTNIGVRIIYRFRLDLEGKAGKEIPESSRLEFLEEFSANNFALSNAQGNTSVSLNRGGIADIHQKSWEPSFWEVQDSCFISISKFDTFNNPFEISALHFRCRRFILLVQTKEVISVSYGSSRRSWKPWRRMRLDLMFTMRDIYINFN